MKKTAALFICMGFFTAQSQSVNTLNLNPNRSVSDALIWTSRGEIVVSDYDNGRVVKVDIISGKTSLVASGLGKANGLYLSPHDSTLYVANPNSDFIYKVDTATRNVIQQISISSPSGLLINPSQDTLIVSCWRDNTIRKLCLADSNITSWHAGYPLNAPVGMCYDHHSGDYFVGNFNDRKIYRIDTQGLHYVATVPAPNTTGFAFLGFIEMHNGLLYASSTSAHQIYAIDPSFTDSVWSIAGKAGIKGNLNGPADSALLNQPNGLLISPNGDTLWISEYGSGKLRYYTTSGLSEVKPSFPKIEIYPNPAQERLYVKASLDLFKNPSNSYQIHDSSGKIWLTTTRFNGNPNVNTSGLPKGLYFLNMRIEGQSLTRSFIVE